MKIGIGDLWTFPATFRVITTNGCQRSDGTAVIGKGCALQAKQRYPDIAHELGHDLDLHGARVVLLSHNIFAFPTKYDWRKPSVLSLIKRSAMQLVELVDEECAKANKELTTVMPPPGCGNGGLDWWDVRAILEPILDDRFTVLAGGLDAKDRRVPFGE